MGAPRIGVGTAFKGWWLIVQGWELLSKAETPHMGGGDTAYGGWGLLMRDGGSSERGYHHF